MTDTVPRSSRRMDRRQFCRSAAMLLTGTAVAGTAGGCSILGVAANAVSRPVVKASYTGLAGQSVAVMVSSDRGTQADFPRLALDLSEGTIKGMKYSQAKAAAELKGTTFPEAASPIAVVRFQKNNPTYFMDDITTVAPRIPATRLIYVEVRSFSLNPNDVLELFRGEMTARVRVLETVPGGTSHVAFDDEVTAHYPDNANTAGTPNLTRKDTYIGTCTMFVTQLLKRFVSYEE